MNASDYLLISLKYVPPFKEIFYWDMSWVHITVLTVQTRRVVYLLFAYQNLNYDDFLTLR